MRPRSRARAPLLLALLAARGSPSSACADVWASFGGATSYARIVRVQRLRRRPLRRGPALVPARRRGGRSRSPRRRRARRTISASRGGGRTSRSRACGRDASVRFNGRTRSRTSTRRRAPPSSACAARGPARRATSRSRASRCGARRASRPSTSARMRARGPPPVGSGGFAFGSARRRRLPARADVGERRRRARVGAERRAVVRPQRDVPRHQHVRAIPYY